ncbi:MAG: tRNA 2-thiouridine(34) synthase MnmA [Desulfonauticus sp.]|nr:tRNA 2-thiouridine(34) synthase MnmA [Desulfonauticus sp.]
MEEVGVLLSGGVDSLCALLTLKSRGYRVVGIHGVFVDQSEKQQKIWNNLVRLAHCFNFPLVRLDLREEFFQQVIKPFIWAYKNGFTPNPCALCNPKIKFGLLLKQALSLGLSKIASGHYVQLRTEKNVYLLFRGKDLRKDQSYFLSLVPYDRLQYLIFPLGDKIKEQILQEIEQSDLTPYIEKESQEVCFIPNDYRQFLIQHGVELDSRGPVKLLDGTVIGEHKGLWNYTLGQRRGLSIAYKEPLYVLKKDVSSNTLYVGPKAYLQAKGVVGEKFNFLVNLKNWPKEIYLQIRYRQSPKKAKLQEVKKHILCFLFEDKEEKPAPGQILAVYSRQGQVLAGGIITGEL